MRVAIGIALVVLGALLLTPVATVRVEQEVGRRQALATLGAGRVAELVEIEAPRLVRIDLAVTSRDRPAPLAHVRLTEWPGGSERVREPLPRRLPPPGGHEYTSLWFPVIRDSAGRTYELSVERDRPLDGGELRVWGSRSAPAGGLPRGGSVGGRLAYRAWHSVTGRVALGTLGERMTAAPLGAVGGAVVVALALAYGATLVFFVGCLRAGPG
jgi:hypothetical protein